MNKKGDLSITTIVVAAISLLILVVLVAVFTGQFGGFVLGLQDCASKGGQCYDSCSVDAAKAAGHVVILPGKSDCSKNPKTSGTGNQICCISPTGTV